ncbi:uncharacterized protein MONBRDRAFT_10201 [Monosiga brevicollis MX1]|uniref:Uncharacterized protein n=1 Tax=Monosiga brevicollis TaxID=81824 RepID=A9V5I3_MONBE|nr:uncharacterized protein MONBRDRAFT_10201 [Monosiga brevicollis MX1]EDQ87289.1 predicted protein [Monosiga brevicollis MX1]|eukprot:XP_001747902.1 hypothetical protein [Monosiga brevicollis MX1]
MAAQSGEEQKAGATGLKASGAEGEFGTRFLVDRAQVFQHNAWFFKDRNWLSKEVPELFLSAEGLPTPDDQLVALPLAEVTQREEAAARDARQEQIQRLQRQHHPRHRKAIQDLFPIAERLTRQALSRDPNVFVYACDYAPSAIDVLRVRPGTPPPTSRAVRLIASDSCASGFDKANRIHGGGALPFGDLTQTSQWYDPKRCHAFVADLASAQELDLPDNSIDVATAVFVLSALTLAEYVQTYRSSPAGLHAPATYVGSHHANVSLFVWCGLIE